MFSSNGLLNITKYETTHSYMERYSNKIEK